MSVVVITGAAGHIGAAEARLLAGGVKSISDAVRA